MALSNKVLYDISTSADWESRGQIDQNDKDYYKKIARENIGAYKDKTKDGGIPRSDLAKGVTDSLDLADTAVQTIYANDDLLITSNRTVTIPQASSSEWGVVQISESLESDQDRVPTSKVLNDTVTDLSATFSDAISDLSAAMRARATFWTEEQWQTQSANPGDPSKIYYVGPKGSGKDQYDAYEWNTNSNKYILTDEATISLDGYWHGDPKVTGTEVVQAAGPFMMNLKKAADDTVSYMTFSGDVGDPYKPVYIENGVFVPSNMTSGYVKGAINTKINTLNYTDSATSGNFVTSVSEYGGYVQVTRAQPQISDVSGLSEALIAGGKVKIVERTDSYDTVFGYAQAGEWPVLRIELSSGSTLQYIYMPLYCYNKYGDTLIFRGFEGAYTLLTIRCKKTGGWGNLEYYSITHSDSNTIDVTEKTGSSNIKYQSLEVKLKDGGGLSADTNGLYISDVTADKINYDTITSGDAYVPVFDHENKQLKVVGGARGLIMNKASDSDYALISCKSALAADADHAANSDKVSNHTVGTDVPADAKFIEYVTAANTFDEIKAIVNAGHEPVLKVESSSGGVSHKLRLPLVYFETGTMSAQVARFSGTHGDKIYTYTLMAGSWSTETTTVSTVLSAGNGIDITNNTVSAKVKTNGGINVDSDGVELDWNYIGLTINATNRQFDGKADTSRIADTALNLSNGTTTYSKGGPTQPVYFQNGIPVACTYKLVVGSLGTEQNTLYFL